MSHSIQSLELFVREMPPDRMPFTVGRSLSAGKRRPRAVLLLRLELMTASGDVVTGRSGDRPSFGWLDKRPDRSPEEKLADLFSLVRRAREIYLELGQNFDSCFGLWHRCHLAIMDWAVAGGHEPLSGSYASALFERALIDATCRAEGKSFFRMVGEGRLGIDPGIHQELNGFDLSSMLPRRQRTRFHIRHTVGFADPLTDADLEKRIDDGEPETLEEYIRRDGLRFFKVKISGNPDADLSLLERIWQVVSRHSEEPVVTLDGNEAYRDLEPFADFVNRMEGELVGLFQHVLFIEQPLTRGLTHHVNTREGIVELSRKKSLVIDEADGELDSFKNALAIGYSGTSHKNCKGVFKSILNQALARRHEEQTGRDAFLSGEDLSNMAIVPLHQDFDALSVLNLDHCERNGHHYAYGMSHLTPAEKASLRRHHPDLYEERDGEYFLRIEEGAVNCGSVYQTGFGGATMPQWEALTGFDEWKPM